MPFFKVLLLPKQVPIPLLSNQHPVWQESTSSFNKLLMSLTAVDSILIKLYIIDSAYTRRPCEPPWSVLARLNLCFTSDCVVLKTIII